MTSTESIKVRVLPLRQLTVQEYRSLKSASLVTRAGAVLAQTDLRTHESAEHLQFRLLKDALTHRHTLDGGVRTVGVWHRGTLTVGMDDTLADYAVPTEPAPRTDLVVTGGQLLQDGFPLPRRVVSMEDLLAPVEGP